MPDSTEHVTNDANAIDGAPPLTIFDAVADRLKRRLPPQTKVPRGTSVHDLFAGVRDPEASRTVLDNLSDDELDARLSASLDAVESRWRSDLDGTTDGYEPTGDTTYEFDGVPVDPDDAWAAALHGEPYILAGHEDRPPVKIPPRRETRFIQPPRTPVRIAEDEIKPDRDPDHLIDWRAVNRKAQDTSVERSFEEAPDPAESPSKPLYPFDPDELIEVMARAFSDASDPLSRQATIIQHYLDKQAEPAILSEPAEAVAKWPKVGDEILINDKPAVVMGTDFVTYAWLEEDGGSYIHPNHIKPRPPRKDFEIQYRDTNTMGIGSGSAEFDTIEGALAYVEHLPCCTDYTLRLYDTILESRTPHP